MKYLMAITLVILSSCFSPEQVQVLEDQSGEGQAIVETPTGDDDGSADQDEPIDEDLATTESPQNPLAPPILSCLDILLDYIFFCNNKLIKLIF